MKIATASYPLDHLTSWAQYEDKLLRWIDEAASHGAELLVFPEYGAMELSTLAGLDVAADLEKSLHAVSERLEEADALHAHFAERFGVHILAASAPSFHYAQAERGRAVNRARLFAPSGKVGVQDKQIMTRFEAEVWDVVPGNGLQLFHTALGKIGILICYDSEFPLLGHALRDAEILLVPSVTEALTGFSRVQIGARARAVENQCIAVMSSVVGRADWSEAVDVSVGAGGVFGPPDRGFPDTGILAQGRLNEPGWIYADVDLATVADVRADGGVLNRRDWAGQADRDCPATVRDLA